MCDVVDMKHMYGYLRMGSKCTWGGLEPPWQLPLPMTLLQ